MIGNTIHQFRSVGSTNDLAKTAIEHGVAEGTVYMADHQTAGRGRRGTSWSDLPGESVLMSIVLYPKTSVSDSWQIGWAASVAVIDTISSYNVAAQCKWPNDVLVEGTKIAGVLVETILREDGSHAVIVGIGVNVNQASFGDASSYRIEPTSLRIVTGRSDFEIYDMADKICQSFNLLYANGSILWPEVAEWYRDELITGSVQRGIDVDSGALIEGTLADIRLTDGAGLLMTSSLGARYAFPDLDH